MEQITIQIPDDAYSELCDLAERQCRTAGQQAAWIVRQALNPRPAVLRADRMAQAEPMFTELRQLYSLNGAPSVRRLAERAGHVLSPTTVHSVLRGSTIPSVSVLDALVTALGGDVQHFRALRGQISPSSAPRPGPATSPR